MNFKQMRNARLTEQQEILDKALAENRPLNDDENARYEVLKTEIANLDTTIENEEANAKRIALEKEPVNKPLDTVGNKTKEPKNEGLRLFKNFGEQLQAIKNAAVNQVIDKRLTEINNSLGANEGIGEDGGFAIQTDFSIGMMESAAASGMILPLTDQYPVGAGSNGVKWIDIEESDVSESVFGGIQVGWAAEGKGVGASKPKLVERKMELEKLMGFGYTTYEMEQDGGTFMSTLFQRGFEKAIQRQLECDVIDGSGVGRPLGLLKSGALIAVAKESGQAAATVVWENIVKMYNRAMIQDDISAYVWLCHPDVKEQFDLMEFPVGTGGTPIYLQESKEGSVASLKGRPVIATDNCKALGSKGDIMFVNLSEYMLLLKGGVQADVSIHVQFLTAENCYRFIFRANGMPKRKKALTIKNSTQKRSPYITLAARA